MLRSMFRSSLKEKDSQINQATEQKIHRPVRCESCVGRISNRGITVLCVLLLCSLFAFRFEDEAEQICHQEKPTYAVYGRNVDAGYLKHVYAVFERLGFERTNGSDWDVLWAHMYPFRVLFSNLTDLQPHQKVNHFPGSGYITQKVELATSPVAYIPTAFRIPADVEKLLQHAKRNPEMLFVQKSNDHRGINIKTVEELDLSADGTFVQEYVVRPLLVDGYKFDIGVYTIQTSVDPLRVYIYNADMILSVSCFFWMWYFITNLNFMTLQSLLEGSLLQVKDDRFADFSRIFNCQSSPAKNRFCPEKYYPFDPAVLDKYVVGDDYLPTWEVPSLQKYFVDLGFSMKDSLGAYLKHMGRDPNKIWEQIDDAIRNVYLSKEPFLIRSAAKYRSKRNFFEMVRFDFVVDEDLNVYIMEANMSPNLSSLHFPPNCILYEQVIFNLFGLVGLGRRIHSDSLKLRSREEEMMQVTDKNLAVHPDICARKMCRTSCMSPECQLCKPCLTLETVEVLKSAYLEHVNRQDCKRIFPPHMTQEEARKGINPDDYSPENQLMYRWFQGKCLLDPTWC